MNLLVIPLVLVGIFMLPFVMSWIEPKPQRTPTGTHRAERQRSSGV